MRLRDLYGHLTAMACSVFLALLAIFRSDPWPAVGGIGILLAISAVDITIMVSTFNQWEQVTKEMEHAKR